MGVKTSKHTKKKTVCIYKDDKVKPDIDQWTSILEREKKE